MKPKLVLIAAFLLIISIGLVSSIGSDGGSGGGSGGGGSGGGGNGGNGTIYIDECQTLGVEGAVYRLENNLLVDEDEVCFEITANDITLNMQGYTLLGEDYDAEGAVYVRGGLKNVNIRNGIIFGFDEGIHIRDVNGVILRNLKINDVGTGIYSRSNYNVKIRDVIVSDSNRDFYFEVDAEEQCNIDIRDFTGSDSQPIKVYNEALFSLRNLDLKNLILCNADHSTFRDLNIQGDSEGDSGLIAYFTDNTVFSDITVRNTESGFLLGYSNDNLIKNIVSVSNEEYGLGILASNNNEISDSNFNGNEEIGIALAASHNNTIKNNMAKNNGDSGVYLEDSTYNTISVNVLNFNQQGITLDDSSSYNKIRDNKIKNNYDAGIEVDNAATSNLIFNNIFHNFVNIDLSSNPLANFFSVEPRNNENIIGGSLIGGNYWATPNGDGFSQTCSDKDSNGICDEAYEIAEGNVDNYPLTM